MRADLINKWIKEVNLLIKESDQITDKITRERRIAMLIRLRADLVRIRDGLK